MQLLKYALNLIFRRKLRTFLTSLGITISVVLLSFIIFGMQDLQKLVVGEFTSRFKPDELIVSNMDINFMQFIPTKKSEEEKEPPIIDTAVVENIRNIQGVTRVRPLLSIRNLDVFLEGDDSAFPFSRMTGWDTPSNDEYYKAYFGDKTTLEEGEAFVSTTFAQYYEVSQEEIIGKNIILKPSKSSLFSTGSKSLVGKKFELKIVGVVDTGNDRTSFVTSENEALEILTDIGGFKNKEEFIKEVGYTQLLLNTVEGQTSSVKDAITSKYDLSVFSSDDLLSFVKTITDGLTLALVMFGIISAIVASIGIINTMVMSIYEQTREIGIIKAIGASRLQVLLIFLIQSGLIGFLGGAFGLAIVYSAMKLSDSYIVDLLAESGFTVEQFFHFQPEIAVVIAVASLFVGVLAGLYPSMKAAGLDPVKALRYE